jgi:hypothetical protein
MAVKKAVASKPSIKSGSRAEKKEAVKALRTTGMRERAAKNKDVEKDVKGYSFSGLPQKTAVGKSTLESAYGDKGSRAKATKAGLSLKKQGKEVAKGYKATDKRMAANTKKAQKTGRMYKNDGGSARDMDDTGVKTGGDVSSRNKNGKFPKK